MAGENNEWEVEPSREPQQISKNLSEIRVIYMDTESTLAKIAEVIRDVTQSGPVDIGRSTQAMDVRGWDSLSYTMILMRLEEVFKVTLPMERVLQLSNVGELTDLVGELHKRVR